MSEVTVSSSHCPQEIKNSIQRYIEHRIRPGSFLSAVLCNSFVDAACKADGNNELFLRGIAQYVHCEVPGNMWGSKEKFENHLKGM